MTTSLNILKECIAKMQLGDSEMACDENARKISIFLNTDHHPSLKNNLPQIVQDFNMIAQLIAKKHNEPPFFVDVNNYRLERERIIVELAKAAARKAMATKQEVVLPAMNAYERRLVHMELAAHPEVRTESMGAGKSRVVTVKLVGEATVEAKTESEPVTQ
jgi:spoIIIJ-associated protein